MKGYTIWTLVFTALVLLSTSTMVVLGIAPSWSQYALTSLAILLTITLYSISTIYRDRSWLHVRSKDEMFYLNKAHTKAMRFGHWNRITSVLFFLIMITPVTLISIYPELENVFWAQAVVFAHYIFTGGGIGGVYTDIWFYYPKYSALWWKYIIAMVICLFLFIGGAFVFNWYEVGHGEIIVMLPGLVHVITTNKE